MPRYDYGCGECGFVREEFHSMHEDPAYVCTRCGKRLTRLPSAGLTPRVVDHSGYHPGLAQRPGDPNAFIDNSLHLQRVLDGHAREGRRPADLG